MKRLMTSRKLACLASITVASIAMPACMSAGTSALKPTLANEVGGPFIEGYLEFGGPADKWVGPRPLMIHVLSEPITGAEIALNPQLIAPDAESAAGEHGELRLSGEIARDQLRALGEAIAQETLPDLAGCLYPVRARLIRADGSFVEKQGCRSIHGWTTVMSLGASRLMTAAYRPSLAPAIARGESTPTPTAPADANRVTASSK